MKTLLALLALACPLKAGTIVHNVYTPPSSASTDVLVIPGFNAEWGTLTDVYVSGFVDMHWRYFAESTWSRVPSQIGYGGACFNTTPNWLRMRVTLPSSGKKLVDETYTINDTVIYVDGFDGIIDFGGTSGFTFDYYTTVPMDPVTRIRNPIYLGEFYGGGDIECNVSRTFHEVDCPDFPGYAGHAMDSAGYFTVTYVFIDS